LERINPDAAGIDCGGTTHVVAVPSDRDAHPVQSFRTFTTDLHRLADWLVACRVTTVALESTGVFWIPVYEILEARGLTVQLVNARHVRNLPGRKSDVSDAEWLRDLHSVGLLRGSFRPTADIVALRTYLRHRHTLVELSAMHVQRMQKALVQMNLQLPSVVSDITGETGLRIIRAIVAGTHDPAVLATHRNWRCRATPAEIQAALTATIARNLFSRSSRISNCTTRVTDRSTPVTRPSRHTCASSRRQSRHLARYHMPAPHANALSPPSTCGRCSIT